MVRLTDCPNMTTAVYPGCKATTQQQQLSRASVLKILLADAGNDNVKSQLTSYVCLL